jgi:DNA-directed RNA polymerase subunit RPC12/RpoP
MSAYNILTATIQCPNCHHTNEGCIQFKFGDTWQHHYKSGDTIKWGGNDIGIANLQAVKVYGILESYRCNECGYRLETEYDILIQHDMIKSVHPAKNIQEYDNDPEGNYIIANSGGLDL